jgi:hypothetical protein
MKREADMGNQCAFTEIGNLQGVIKQKLKNAGKRSGKDSEAK